MNQKTDSVIENLYYIAIMIGILFIVGVFHEIYTNKSLTLDKYLLKCKAVSFQQSNNKTICEEFELAYINTERIKLNNTELISFVNEHCIDYDSKKNCKSVLLNFTSSELSDIKSGLKNVKTDFLGTLEF